MVGLYFNTRNMSAILKALQNRKSVELKSEVVEFSLIDDLKKLASISDDELKNFETFKGELEKVKRAALVNKKQATVTQKTIAKELDSFSSKAKELGINPREVKEYKEASQKFSDLSVIIAEYNTTYK